MGLSRPGTNTFDGDLRHAGLLTPGGHFGPLTRLNGTMDRRTGHVSRHAVEVKMRSALRVIAILFCTVAAEAQLGRILPADDPIADEYIVMLKDTPPSEVSTVALSLAHDYDGDVLAVFHHSIVGFGIRMSRKAAEALARSPRVFQVEENGRAFLSYTVQEFADDTWWHLDRIDNRGPLYAYRAYAYTSSGQNVNLYILGTGVLASHEQFGSRVRTGVTFGDALPATNPCGGYYDWLGPGHETSVASVAAGNTNGVAKDATIIPVKVWNCNPVNGAISTQILWWCWAIDWILGDAQSMQNQGRRAVVNISGGFTVASLDGDQCDDGHGGTTPCLAAFEHQVNLLVQNNITVVAAANNFNNGNCNTTPARLGYGGTIGSPYHTITVGGSSESDTRWVRSPSEMIPGSSFDRGSNFGPCVDIYAPAHNLWHLAHINGPTSYRTVLYSVSGTSFAAPIVTGIVARLLQKFPAYSPQAIWSYIQAQANHPSCFDVSVTPCNDRLAYISPYD
jgi:subtilisin family serine protease